MIDHDHPARVYLRYGIFASFAALVVIDFFDSMTTLIGLANPSDGLVELNPIGKWFIQQFGLVLGIGILKIASLAVILVVCIAAIRSDGLLDDEAVLGALLVVIFIGLEVLGSNYALLSMPV